MGILKGGLGSRGISRGSSRVKEVKNYKNLTLGGKHTMQYTDDVV